MCSTDLAIKIMEKMNELKWGKIEIIIKDSKVTQINRIEEERLNS